MTPLARGCLAFVLALLFALPPAALSQDRPAAARPDPAKVFAALIEPYRSIDDYIVKISAKVSMPSMRVPDFSATLYFKKPDRFHVETRSFAPIPRNAAVFNPLQFDPAKNRIAFLGSEPLGKLQADLYRVEPRDPRSRLREFKVWVGNAPARILQVESVSVQGTRARVTPTYKTVSQGKDSWLMPERIGIHLTFPESMSPVEAPTLTEKDAPFSGGMRRLDEMTGEGDVEIVYSNWQINVGIDDTVFQKDAGR